MLLRGWGVHEPYLILVLPGSKSRAEEKRSHRWHTKYRDCPLGWFESTKSTNRGTQKSNYTLGYPTLDFGFQRTFGVRDSSHSLVWFGLVSREGERTVRTSSVFRTVNTRTHGPSQTTWTDPRGPGNKRTVVVPPSRSRVRTSTGVWSLESLVRPKVGPQRIPNQCVSLTPKQPSESLRTGPKGECRFFVQDQERFGNYGRFDFSPTGES